MINLSEPFQFEFFVRGLIAATLAGSLCGLIGVYIVLRRMSYIGHGLAHAIFGGAVVSFVINVNFYIGAGLWGFLSALLINLISSKRKIGADAAIGIVTTASFALGVALISHVRRFTKNFEAALFGNILGVTQRDLVIIAIVLAITLLVVFFFYKQLLFATFDPEVAPAYGVSTQRMDSLFALVRAGAIIASLQVLGATLIAAAIVVPAIMARLLTDSFHRVMVMAVLIGAGSGFLGMYISYFVDVSSGANIVLLQAALFSLVMVYSTLRGRWPFGRVQAPIERRVASVPEERGLFE